MAGEGPNLQPKCSNSTPYMLQVQKGRDDVMLEFPADDTAGGDHEDALCEMSFHVPKESDRFGGEETVSAAEVRRLHTSPTALGFAQAGHKRCSLLLATQQTRQFSVHTQGRLLKEYHDAAAKTSAGVLAMSTC